jgi:serine protease Do
MAFHCIPLDFPTITTRWQVPDRVVLVGINTAILSRTGGNQGIGFAVPVNLARYVMERIISEGKVRRGYLGVKVQALTPELAKQLNLSGQTGALVAEVTPDSPAEKGRRGH